MHKTNGTLVCPTYVCVVLFKCDVTQVNTLQYKHVQHLLHALKFSMSVRLVTCLTTLQVAIVMFYSTNKHN